MSTEISIASPVVKIFENPDALASYAADVVIESARDAIARRGRFTLVLTGGTTPEKTYKILAKPDRASQIDWLHTYVFFGDERFVPADDSRSNYAMAQRTLLSRIPIPFANIFPVPTKVNSAAEAAKAYYVILADFFSLSESQPPPCFDFIFMGLGSDGHTASLFPFDNALYVKNEWVVWTLPGILPPPVDRITLTYPVFNTARKVVFLVEGNNKAVAVREVLEDHVPRENRPAAGVQPFDGSLIWLIDTEAARLLTEKHETKFESNMGEFLMTSIHSGDKPMTAGNADMPSHAGKRLAELHSFGQSIWIDFIDRKLIDSGELERMIADDYLCGVTTNPSIFEKALTSSTDYDEFLATAEKQNKNKTAISIYERMAANDVRDAAGILRPVYDRTRGLDGYVSLEVSPYLAHDTAGTITEARRLWNEVDRENVFIKVPATPQGIPAIEQLISEGININVTLLFSGKVYEQVADAYINGMEKLAASGADISKTASVASFFVSRIDSSIDKILESKIAGAINEEEKSKYQSLVGKVAIANAKLAYQKFKDIYNNLRWQKLAKHGARVQRLLWASTSTKNPKYRDVIYVEELIGRDTVNTMPPATLKAFRDHGQARPSLEEKIDDARKTMQSLNEVGISMDTVTNDLLDDGVRLFSDSFDRLLAAIESKLKK